MSLDVVTGLGVEATAGVIEAPESNSVKRARLTLFQVNKLLEGSGWVGTEMENGVYKGQLGKEGFELVQGQFDYEGELWASTDSLPVLSAWQVGNKVEFVLKSADPDKRATIHLDELAA